MMIIEETLIPDNHVHRLYSVTLFRRAEEGHDSQ